MITVSKEVLINTGKFENIKIIASITATDDNFEIAWKAVNEQIAMQEALERANRLGVPSAPQPPAGFVKVGDEMPF